MNNIFKVWVHYTPNKQAERKHKTYHVLAEDDVIARKRVIEWHSKTNKEHTILYCEILHSNELIGELSSE